MNTETIETTSTTSETLVPAETAPQALAWNGESVALGATTETETEIETSTDVGLTEQAVRDELEVLRAKYEGDQKANRDEASALAQTQRTRLHDFLQVGYRQARDLMRDENRALLNSLLLTHKIAPGPSTTKFMQQIAALQLAAPKSLHVVPGRRNERIGVLYRIFFDKGWTADGLVAKIIEAKGTTAIIAQDIKDRRDPEEERNVARRATAVRNDEYGTMLLPMPDVTVKNTGEWRLALVSVHDGGVRLRSLVGTGEDTATTKARDAYCADAYIDLRSREFDGTTATA